MITSVHISAAECMDIFDILLIINSYFECFNLKFAHIAPLKSVFWADFRDCLLALPHVFLYDPGYKPASLTETVKIPWTTNRHWHCCITKTMWEPKRLGVKGVANSCYFTHKSSQNPFVVKECNAYSFMACSLYWVHAFPIISRG